ncbi:MAG: hypothetical protein C0600_11475 [Ignavibacteria bacterium]|nr:MAG: hypothetical protein C0600_11475 [Ignavibacteria bacterium]
MPAARVILPSGSWSANCFALVCTEPASSSQGTLMRTSKSIRLITIMLCLCSVQGLHAQPDLNFKRIRLEWPYVEVYLSVGCDGIKNYFLQRSDISIREDGRELGDFGIWCPDPTSRCPITVSLVFDASDSMMGEGNTGAKEGGYNFISFMDNVIDEANVVFFNHGVTVFQHTTTDTARLRNAVSYLPTVGSTAVWDGIYMGALLAKSQGSNQCRAVIALTDGEDNSSKRNLEEVVAYAVENNIRVFTIGYGDDIREDHLSFLAQITGGEYFHTPDATQLASIYKQISTIIYEFFQECLVSYEPRCADGMTHEVELGIPDLCGGSAYATRSYTAPRDSTTFRTKHISLGECTVSGGAEARVPLILHTPFFREMLYPLTLDLAFDPHGLRLDRVETPPGTMLAGMNVHSADLEDGGRVRVPESRVLEGSDTLCILVFKTTTTSTTISYPLAVDSVAFEKGCVLPVIQDGMVECTPSAPGITCTLSAPDALEWNSGEHRYDPNPFEVRMELNNAGTLAGQGGRVRIEFDPLAFELSEPGTLVQQTGELEIEGTTAVTWKLIARGQGTAARKDICLRATFDNHPDVVCCATLDLPQAGIMLSCSYDVPQIIYNESAKSFVPNPFDLDLQVRNIGVVTGTALSAVLQLPEGVYIEAGETYEKTLSPENLSPGSNGNSGWKLRIVSWLGGDRFPIQVQLRSGGQKLTTCIDTLVLPWIPPDAWNTITASGPLAFCEGDSVLLDAGAGYSAYKWSSGERSRFLTVTRQGNYFVACLDAQGQTLRSDTVVVTVYSMPKVPVITRQGNTLISDARPPLQWYRNGVAIDGATQPRLTVGALGSYEVRVWTHPLCSSQSEPFIVNVLSQHGPVSASTFSLEVFPDPTTGLVNLEIHSDSPERVHLQVYSVLGKTCLNVSLELLPGVNRYQHDLSAVSDGIYFVTMTGASGRAVRRLLKQ